MLEYLEGVDWFKSPSGKNLYYDGKQREKPKLYYDTYNYVLHTVY